MTIKAEFSSCANGEPHDPHSWKIGNRSFWCEGRNTSGFPVGNQEWERPSYYGGEDNPFEPIKIIEHYDLNFYLGNVIKYVLRAGQKKPDIPESALHTKEIWELKDLKKAYTYIGLEIRKRERERSKS